MGPLPPAPGGGRAAGARWRVHERHPRQWRAGGGGRGPGDRNRHDHGGRRGAPPAPVPGRDARPGARQPAQPHTGGDSALQPASPPRAGSGGRAPGPAEPQGSAASQQIQLHHGARAPRDGGGDGLDPAGLALRDVRHAQPGHGRGHVVRTKAPPRPGPQRRGRALRRGAPGIRAADPRSRSDGDRTTPSDDPRSRDRSPAPRTPRHVLVAAPRRRGRLPGPARRHR